VRFRRPLHPLLSEDNGGLSKRLGVVGDVPLGSHRRSAAAGLSLAMLARLAGFCGVLGRDVGKELLLGPSAGLIDGREVRAEAERDGGLLLAS
jgi:hypothetical protein